MGNPDPGSVATPDLRAVANPDPRAVATPHLRAVATSDQGPVRTPIVLVLVWLLNRNLFHNSTCTAGGLPLQKLWASGQMVEALG